jgi:hypothetical protein
MRQFPLYVVTLLGRRGTSSPRIIPRRWDHRGTACLKRRRENSAAKLIEGTNIRPLCLMPRDRAKDRQSGRLQGRRRNFGFHSSRRCFAALFCKRSHRHSEVCRQSAGEAPPVALSPSSSPSLSACWSNSPRTARTVCTRSSWMAGAFRPAARMARRHSAHARGWTWSLTRGPVAPPAGAIPHAGRDYRLWYARNLLKKLQGNA